MMSRREISAFFGDGSPERPMIFFEDAYLRISYETYDADGSFAGWGGDTLEPAEYFKRRLKGK